MRPATIAGVLALSVGLSATAHASQADWSTVTPNRELEHEWQQMERQWQEMQPWIPLEVQRALEQVQRQMPEIQQQIERQWQEMQPRIQQEMQRELEKVQREFQRLQRRQPQ